MSPVVSINSAKRSNPGVSGLSAVSERDFPKNWANGLVMRVAQALWPSKPDMALSQKTARSDRLCRYWLENKYSLGADDLVMLLRTDEGLQVLEGVMGDSKPIWWRDFKRSVKRAELRRQQKAIQKALDEDEQGELGI
ncbi:MAG: hypothetical protein JWR80_10035 [Bradyrhizobium sp.]|nr:hypothetical protein [Bradyrhizobium sp.]